MRMTAEAQPRHDDVAAANRWEKVPESPAALRVAERRRRESDAPRLAAQVPSLVSLQLDIEDRSGVVASKHIRRYVVDRAPALFLVPCVDPRWIDGGHDLTFDVMRALRAREGTFEGTDNCIGSVGPSPCGRVLHFKPIATYFERDEVGSAGVPRLTPGHPPN